MPEPKPTGNDMPINPNSPKAGCVSITIVLTLVSLGIWKVVDLFVFFYHYIRG
jgi:hypothetical protein